MSDLITNLGIDWRLLLAQIVNFALLFWLLQRFAFVPLGKFLSERSKKIEKGLKDAEFAAGEREKLKMLRIKMLAEGQKEVKTMMSEARLRSDKEIESMWEKAKQRKEQLVGEARQEIEEEKARVLGQARAEVAQLVLLVSEKVLGEKVDEKRDKVLVDKALKEIRQ